MKTIDQLIRTHLTKYPLMELTDAAKLLYQNELGPGHMISDEPESLKKLYAEWETLPHSTSSSFVESIGNGLSRISLSALKYKELPILNAMFCQTAGYIQGNKDNFIRNLDCLTAFFPGMDTERFLEEYRSKGYPPVSHSTAYRKAYHPAYRIVMDHHASYLYLIRTLDSMLEEKGSLILGIDGNCGSGKTTLSRLLDMYFDCNIIPMDDFFLPPHLRTYDRLAEPGGNIHYERFASEIMKPLQNGQPVSYRPFCCSDMKYGEKISLPRKPFYIVEGSYCLHPKLQGLYGYSVFLSCSHAQQLKRIHARNGEGMLKNFTEKWIPMENRYFDTFRIRENCNVRIET